DASLLQRQNIDFLDRQSLQIGQANFCLVRRCQRFETALRQTTLQRHLTAFETNLVETARTRFLTFMTTTGRLAQAGADTATDATLSVLGAVCRLNGVQFHDFLRT